MMRSVFVLSLAFSAITINAQFAISGKVTSESGEKLPGASVYLLSSKKSVPTGIDGVFMLKNIPSGNDTLMVKFMGYEDHALGLLVDKDLSLSIQLKTATYLADEIVVRATRAVENEPIAYSNLDFKSIASKNLGQDIPLLLSQQPSLITTSDAGMGVGYTGFRIRGSDANRINVTVNGIPMNDAESQGTYWVNMPDMASSIKNIQIQRGVGTSTNGAGAFGATVNIQTNTLNKEPFAQISSSAGSFNTFKNTVQVGSGLINKHFSFDARLSKIGTEGYIDRASSDLKSFFVSGGYYSDKTVVKLNIFSGIEHTYQAWNGVPSYLLDNTRTYNSCGEYYDASGNVVYYDNQTDNYQQDHFQLFITQKINQYLYVNAALHYTYGRGYYEEYKEDQDLADYLLDNVLLGDSLVQTTDLIRQKWLDNDFYGAVFSANYKRNRSDITFGGGWNKYDGRHFGNVIWAQYMSNGTMGHEWYKGTGIKTDFNLYGKYNYLIVTGLNAYIDLQYRRISHEIDGVDANLRDLTQSHQFNFFNPKAGLYYSINEQHKAYIFYAIGNREPNRSNYTDADPNGPQPEAEKMNDFEAGYTFSLSHFTAGINTYVMQYNNQLVLTGEINDVGSPVMANAKESYRSGVELNLAWNLFSQLKLMANATLSQNKINDFVEYVDDWNTGIQHINSLGKTDIAFSPSTLINGQLVYTPVDNLELGFATQFVGKQYIDNTSNEDRILPSYFVNNVSLGYSIHPANIAEISFNLLVNNLFNFTYSSNAWVYSYYLDDARGKLDGFYPQAGINFMAGITVRF